MIAPHINKWIQAQKALVQLNSERGCGTVKYYCTEMALE